MFSHDSARASSMRPLSAPLAALTPTRALDVSQAGPPSSPPPRLPAGVWERRGGSVFADTPPPPARRQQTAREGRAARRIDGLPRLGEHAHLGVTGVLQQIGYEAKLALLRRAFLSWALWAERHGALSRFTRRLRLRTSFDLARYYFAKWTRRARASLAWAEAYAHAEALERQNTRPRLLFWFSRWCAVGALSLELRWVAERLRDRNLLRTARDYFLCWKRHRRLTEQKRTVVASMAHNARALAMRYFATWQTRAIRRLLSAPLQAANALVLQQRYLTKWRRWAHVSRSLSATVSQSLVALVRRYFACWRRHHSRRVAAAELSEANTCYALLLIFREWSWRAQLALLRYEHYVVLQGLPEL